MRICILVSIVLIGLSSSGALAERDTANAATCALYAGHPWEPGMAGRGAEWGAIEDTDLAALACRRALEEQPGDPVIAFRLARTLMQAEQYGEALPLLLDAAEAGYSPAQTALGTAYSTGVGAEKNIPLAEKWLKLAAAQGHPIAQNNLGGLYSSLGGSLPRNDREAMRLFKLAADQGYPLAQANLGRLYRWGVGTETNLAEARRLYELAAPKGDAVAQSELGELLLNAPSDPADIPRAIDLLNSAALQHNVFAHFHLGLAYLNGVGVLRDPFAARAHLEFAEAQGDPMSLYYLSFLYADDQGVGRDPARSFSYRLRAAEAGVTYAIGLVGIAYHRGEGVDEDQVLAEKWLSRAAALGDPDAQYLTAVIWLGSKRPDVRSKALEYAESAGRSGLGAAFLLIADYYISIKQWERALGYATLALDTPGSENDARLKIDAIKPKLPQPSRGPGGPSVG